ncbi:MULTISPECIES: flippase [unclassified Tatumella]|uniref:flippase n=1 Tax=unclassified Tatumella TaxID=2649542 RepID=UPI001BAF374E|nr:flippase [Tatumella sp. JGM16]MBS0913793.1 flippase [Tatumella sp. JGM91]
MSNVRKNIVMLLIVQLSNYLFPLITFPYLSRVLGPDGFGSISFAQSIITYMTFIIDFGFNLTITKKISQLHSAGSLDKIPKVFANTLLAKFFMLIISIITCFILSLFSDKVNSISYLIYIGFVSLFGSAIFPIWYFQGVQKMKKIAISTTISKVICLFLTFILVKDSNDLNMAMFVNSLMIFSAGVISYYYIFQERSLFFVTPSIRGSFILIRDSFPIFLSYIGSSVYTTLNVFFLGLYSSVSQLGVYSSADKIRAVAQNALSPVSQAIYPHLATYTNDKKIFFIKHSKYSRLLILFSMAISVFLIFCSHFLIRLFLDERYVGAEDVLIILSFLPFVVGVAICYGQWGLVNLGKEKLLSKIYLYTGLSHLVHIFIAIKIFGVLGAASSVLFTECLVSLLIFIYFNKSKKEIMNEF